MLNYLYGMLEIRTRIQMIADGHEPTRGILHGDGSNGRDAYVFDLMEPGRPKAEKRLLTGVYTLDFEADDFTQSRSGTCRLGPRVVAALLGDAIDA